jgi:Fe2+ transport system protein B
MVNIFQSTRYFALVTYLTTAAFATIVIAPPPLTALAKHTNSGLYFNDINFFIKIEKIYEKIQRAINKKETNKIVSHMFDFKREIEQYTGQKIDLPLQMDAVQKEARLRGLKIQDKFLKAIKKEFGKQESKHKHRAEWFAQCAELDIPYSSEEADIDFEMHSLRKQPTHKDKDQNKDEVQIEEVPVKIMVGVTVSLCGLFLWFVPIPACQTTGTWLINTGVGILGSDALDRWDAYDKEQRKKDEKKASFISYPPCLLFRA